VFRERRHRLAQDGPVSVGTGSVFFH
jgi:hypothetical protein